MKKRYGHPALFVASLLLVLLSCSRKSESDLGGEYKDLVLGEVAGKKFTVADLEKKLRYQYGVVHDANGHVVPQTAQEILKSSIDELCWVRYGESKGYQNLPAFKDTWELARRYILTDQTINQEVGSKETPTEDDIRLFYDQHKNEYLMPTRVKTAHVLVKTKQEADQVRARLLKGESVGDLAAKLSIDAASKNTGGLIGWLTATGGAGALGNQTGLNDAAMKMKKGDVSEPIHIPAGWSVLVALDREESQVHPLDAEMVEAISKRVQTKKHNEIYGALLNKLRTEYGEKLYQDNFDIYARGTMTQDELWTAAQQDKDPAKRILDYRELVKRFSTTPQAPQAEFMIGFTQADLQKDYASARASFATFLKDYPGHALAPAARWMLDNMDKPDADHAAIDELRRDAFNRTGPFGP